MFAGVAAILLSLALMFHTVHVGKAFTCVQQLDSCSCETDAGFTLDLSPHDRQINGLPPFSVLVGSFVYL